MRTLPWLMGLVVLILAATGLIPDTLLLGREFLVTYFGVLLGLVLTTVTFMYGVIDRLQDKLTTLCKGQSESSDKVILDSLQRLSAVNAEVRSDTLLVFGAFVFAVAVPVFDAISWPKWCPWVRYEVVGKAMLATP